MKGGWPLVIHAFCIIIRQVAAVNVEVNY